MKTYGISEESVRDVLRCLGISTGTGYPHCNCTRTRPGTDTGSGQVTRGSAYLGAQCYQYE